MSRVLILTSASNQVMLTLFSSGYSKVCRRRCCLMQMLLYLMQMLLYLP
jgi:hypothetical protein